MGATYEYLTGSMERDFHFVKAKEICSLRGLNAYAGGHACMSCPFNQGAFDPIELPGDKFVMCGHRDSEDSEGSVGVISLFYDRLQHEALCALCD